MKAGSNLINSIKFALISRSLWWAWFKFVAFLLHALAHSYSARSVAIVNRFSCALRWLKRLISFLLLETFGTSLHVMKVIKFSRFRALLLPIHTVIYVEMGDERPQDLCAAIDFRLMQFEPWINLNFVIFHRCRISYIIEYSATKCHIVETDRVFGSIALHVCFYRRLIKCTYGTMHLVIVHDTVDKWMVA